MLRAASITRSTVSGLSMSGLVKARDTVERLTPASAATWLIVGLDRARGCISTPRPR